jgi:hypothetical protein
MCCTGPLSPRGPTLGIFKLLKQGLCGTLGPCRQQSRFGEGMTEMGEA